ncbi:MAG: MurR/RpiR family transcriptional regulator, partial [Paracoccaceae bacterium]
AISFAPYSEETLALVADARARNLPVVALTDHKASPLARMADPVLTVQEVDFGAFRSLSATLTMAIALAVAVGTARGTQG